MLEGIGIFSKQTSLYSTLYFLVEQHQLVFINICDSWDIFSSQIDYLYQRYMINYYHSSSLLSLSLTQVIFHKLFPQNWYCLSLLFQFSFSSSAWLLAVSLKNCGCSFCFTTTQFKYLYIERLIVCFFDGDLPSFHKIIERNRLLSLQNCMFSFILQSLSSPCISTVPISLSLSLSAFYISRVNYYLISVVQESHSLLLFFKLILERKN